MKYCIPLLLLLIVTKSFSQINSLNIRTNSNNDVFQSFPNDPIDLRLYTLKNGLKVYLAPNHDIPRIRTAIVVKAGSKQDRPDATGLAHYLEHLLFKGTDKLGTVDYDKELPLLNEIENLFEIYRKTTDSIKRKEIYRHIDSLSYEASKYAISREYNNIMTEMGAWGVNAFTNFDRTGYVSNIPSNQLNKWLHLESERFRNPQFRTFHTELEAVYEEMNTIIDDGPRFALFQLFEVLFPNHPYGSQTSIGKIEHLKNPSLKAIKEYFNKYYVPNNMAIILVGDFDPDVVIIDIEKQFGDFKKRNIDLTEISYQPELAKPLEKTISAPGQDMIRLGFRFDGVDSEEALMVKLTDIILANGKAGLFDLNINNAQAAKQAGSFVEGFKDHTVHHIYGTPKEDQTLEELRDILFKEISNIKEGNFPEWLVEASVNNLLKFEMQQLESFEGISSLLMESYSFDIPWDTYINQIKSLKTVTKKELSDFVKSNYGNNYGIIYKKKGLEADIKKISKPQITPIETNRHLHSIFYESLAEIKTYPIEPKFIDYYKDITHDTLRGIIPIHYLANKTNNIFKLKIIIDKGQNEDRLLEFAINNYLPFANTLKLSSREIEEAFFKLGCDFKINANLNNTEIVISGLSGNFEKAIDLMTYIIENVEDEKSTFDKMLEDIISNRNTNVNSSRSKRIWALNYIRNGALQNNLSTDSLQDINSSDLVIKIKNLFSESHSIYLYSPMDLENSKAVLDKYFTTLKQPDLKKEEINPFPPKTYKKQEVYLVDSEDKQIAIRIIANIGKYDPNLSPSIYLFNEYFNQLFLDEIRESRGLAYSAVSIILIPTKPFQSLELYTSIGTQSDKYLEAIQVANELLRDIPINKVRLRDAKNSMIEKIRSERITKFNLLDDYINTKSINSESDKRKIVFENIDKITPEQFKSFCESYIENSILNFLLVGDLSVIQEEKLKQFGQIKKLETKEIFGY